MTRDSLSQDSLEKANKSRASFSGHGEAMGAAGVREKSDVPLQDQLDRHGESQIISPPEGGFGKIHAGLAWNNIIVEKAGGFMGLIKKATKQGVDLDLGCFYELEDETRGILQPFGELFGKFNERPFIKLSGDDRTGDAEGDDEFFTINGAHWPEIKRILIYTYIYKGAQDWAQIKPEVTLDLGNGDAPIIIKPSLHTDKLTVCALATINNVKGGIQIITHGEYFTSHAAMDRAFGFGLNWEDGVKN